MKDPEEQKIIVLTELLNSDKNTILHGIKLAGIFHKELCLFHCLGKEKEANFLRADEALQGYKSVLKKDIPQLKVSTLILEGSLHKLMDDLTDEYEAVLIVAPTASYKKRAKAFRVSSIPFLFINNQCDTISTYKKITIPIDLRRETSDAGLWCGYFGKFNGSDVVATVATDKNKDNIKSITKNVLKLKKHLEKFNIPLRIYKGRKNSFRIQFEALQLAIQTGSDLYVTLGSSIVTPIDIILGLPEKKILKNAGSLPVLIVNPRKDMYVLCD